MIHFIVQPCSWLLSVVVDELVMLAEGRRLATVSVVVNLG